MTVSPTLLSVPVSWTRLSNFDAFVVFLKNGSMIRRSRFPPQGPPGRVPLLQRYYQSATTSCRPSRRTSLPSFGGTSVALVLFAPRRTSAPSRPGVGNPVVSDRDVAEETAGSPKFLGNPDCPFAHVPIRLRQDCSHQTITVQQRGPWYNKSKGSHERSFEAQ